MHIPTATTLQKHPNVYHITRDTTVLNCLQKPPYNNIHLSTILPEIQLCFPAYSNHLTITSVTTVLTLQKHTDVYHTTRDAAVLTCLQQPPSNSIHMSIILPDTTILICLQQPPYNYIHMSTIQQDTTILTCLPAYSNHLTITSTCLPYYQRSNCNNYTYLPTTTTFQ